MIFVVGAKCERCGESDDRFVDHYLMRYDGDKWQTLCKNVVHCEERQRANSVGQ